MGISRRLRFEILRRDNYTCRYCGARAPDVTLTVDHVLPTTLGGDDDPRNLVTACRECNAGKTSMAPDQPIVEDVDATAMLFSQAVERAAALRRSNRREIDAVIDEFDEYWSQWPNADDGGPIGRNDDWRNTLERFIGYGFDLNDLKHFTRVAMNARVRGAVWSYFCGCCWREVTTRQELARRLIEDGDV